MNFLKKNLALSILLFCGTGCRNVAIISDSIIADYGFYSPATIISDAINNTNGENHLVTLSSHPGRTAFNHRFLEEIYSKGLSKAFRYPDAVIFSFATNDINKVRTGAVSYESAQLAFWSLAHQAVEAGATCIVVAEWSHILAGVADFTPLADQWFSDIRAREGQQSYLGRDYAVVIADVSAEVHAKWGTYVIDYIHPTESGAQLLAGALTQALGRCPEGRWIHNSGLKEGVQLPVPWYNR